ncbi:MAG: hypothetical protein ACOYNS_02940 [Bacteroidota bacterium]
MRILCAVLLVMLMAGSAHAQSGFHRPARIVLDSNIAALRFERNVNTYLWTAESRYRFDDSDLFVNVADRFTSSYIKTLSASFRDDQSFSLAVAKNLYGPFAAAVEAQSYILSDNQTVGSSNAGIHSAAAGITYQPVSSVTVTPMIGMRIDKQQREQDEGLNYRLYGDADDLEFSGYRAVLSGHLNQSSMGKRYFKRDSAAVSIATQFSENSSDSVRVMWMNNRNDFYIAAAETVQKVFGVPSNIRSRIEDQYGIQNTLSYDVGGGLNTELIFNIDSRTIRNAFRYNVLSDLSSIAFNTSVKEFRLDGQARMSYISSSTLMSVGFVIGERDEKHLLEKIDGVDNNFQENRSRQESRLDNTAFRNMINTYLFSELSADDHVTFSGSASILRYDTPDTVNTDDRDELLISLSLKETHRFSSVFTASLTAEMTNAHLVYLLSEKSANNNWNRIYRLVPEMTYHPADNFRMFNSFEVLANYTVFDFETVIPDIKSYSYRQVAFLDSTSYDMTKRVGVDMTAYVRFFERGEFHWADFSERPLQRIEEVTFSPQIRYSTDGKWFFAVGFRSFAQKKFEYKNNQRQFVSTFLSAGPTTSVSVRLSAASGVEIRGWKEFQHQSGGVLREYSNMTMNVRYYF